jgi:peptidoglycan/xylan/chitin deacetylase (PgdA/CDA1 family)
MPGRKARTNRFLIILSLFLCLFCGALFTQSSATPSPIDEGNEPDMFVAGSSQTSAQLTTGEEQASIDSTPEETPAAFSEEATPTPTGTPTPVPTEEPVVFEPSAEASQGVWTSSGSNWMFMVSGSAYTGWLIDTDGKHYYFDSNGIMQTGWLDEGGNRYYLDEDGIMQTGDILIDQELCHFRQDGIYTGSGDTAPDPAQETVPETETATTAAPEQDTDLTPTPAAEDTPDATVAPTEEPTVTPEATATPEPTATPKPTATPEPTATPTPAATPVPDKTIALTFDDGPTDYTSEILDLLEESQTKATFFMSGAHMENYPDTIARMQSLGCELGNHAYTHFDLSELNLEDSSAEIAGVDELLYSYLGVTTEIMRPPYGNMNTELAGQIRKPIILWSIDSQDDTLTDAQQIADTVLANAEDGGIILMHDTSEISAEAAKILIPALAQEGYELVTISELASEHGIELLSGSTYTSFTDAE